MMMMEEVVKRRVEGRDEGFDGMVEKWNDKSREERLSNEVKEGRHWEESERRECRMRDEVNETWEHDEREAVTKNGGWKKLRRIGGK
ncbi:hypothetical protein KM043_008059 [Ampulex compressa]|nr:hypothetical protein KM043_008059 [Ampulex compressa]